MKSLRDGWQRVCSFENLILAYRKAARGKSWRHSVLAFELQREKHLLELRDALCDGTYQPGPHRTFTITCPKARLIAAAPFRDRVVQHALCNVIQPFFEKSFIAHTYGCILGRGTHRAVDRYTELARTHRYVLRLDIKRFFPSIDHKILFGLLCHRIVEAPLRRLIETILSEGEGASEPVVFYLPGDTLFSPLERTRGLPIGNLTSQFWANLYLDGLDHFVTETLCCGAYIRYMDDMVVFGDSRAALRDTLRSIREWLGKERRLLLHETKCHVRNVAEGVTFLGYRVWPYHRRVTRENAVRARRRAVALATAYRERRIEFTDARASLMAWVGHTRHANARSLEKLVLERAVFSRAAAS